MAGSGSSSNPRQPQASESAFREEDVEEYIEIPDVIGGKEADYILQLKTESMRSAGLLQDDYVVVRPTKEADADTIVVVANGDEVALMRVYRDGEELRLRPEGEEAKATATSEACSTAW